MFTEIRCLKLNFDNVNWFNSTSNHAKLYLLWPDRGVLDSFFSGMISSNRSTNLLSWPQGLVARCTTKADLSVLRLGTRSGRGVAFFPGVCSAIWNKQIKWYVLDSFVCKSDSWINSAKHHVGEWGWRSIKVHPRWDSNWQPIWSWTSCHSATKKLYSGIWMNMYRIIYTCISDYMYWMQQICTGLYVPDYGEPAR